MDTLRLLKTALAAATLTGATLAWSQPAEFARLTSTYSNWAGSKANAEALVAGLRDARTITLVTQSPTEGVSLAGFTPSRPMTYASISALLSSAQRTLARAGITRPSAEEIQAALIGGDITTAEGRTLQLPQHVAAR